MANSANRRCCVAVVGPLVIGLLDPGYVCPEPVGEDGEGEGEAEYEVPKSLRVVENNREGSRRLDEY